MCRSRRESRERADGELELKEDMADSKAQMSSAYAATTERLMSGGDVTKDVLFVEMHRTRMEVRKYQKKELKALTERLKREPAWKPPDPNKTLKWKRLLLNEARAAEEWYRDQAEQEGDKASAKHLTEAEKYKKKADGYEAEIETLKCEIREIDEAKAGKQ